MMENRESSQVSAIIEQGLRRRDEADLPRYAALKLTANPFPLASIASAELGPFSGPLGEDVAKQINDFLRTTTRERRFVGLRIVGDYGFGKTHLLRWLEFHINESGKGRIRAYYVDNPHLSPRELIFSLTRAVGEEELRKQIWLLLLQEVEKRYQTEGTAFLRSLRRLPAFQPTLPSLEGDLLQLVTKEALAHYQRFLETFLDLALDRDQLKRVAAEALDPVVGNPEVVKELVDFALEERYSAFRSWLALTSAETRKKLVVPQQDHFRAVINILHRNGVEYVYLLVDEFEDISSARLTKRKQAEYAAALRILIDSNLTDFALVIGVTEKGWDDLREVYPAIEKRFTLTASLKPLGKNEIARLIQRYLDRSRRDTGYAGLVGKGLSPFSEEAISAIHELVERNPRTIIGFCHRLIELCAGRELSLIDRPLVASLARGESG